MGIVRWFGSQKIIICQESFIMIFYVLKFFLYSLKESTDQETFAFQILKSTILKSCLRGVTVYWDLCRLELCNRF